MTDRATGPSVGPALASARERLSRAGIDSASLDAEVLLCHVTAMRREELLSASKSTLTGAQAARFEQVLRRRLEREPVAYITGNREFWSLDFHVTNAVLIPRPETERLVEIAVELVSGLNDSGPPRVLDIGTGSGAIAVALAKELPFAELWATDLSTAALAVARGNAGRNGVADRVRFLCGDLLEAVAVRGEKFALIVSNPPYIRSSEIAGLEPEVGGWEPRAALDGGADGLDFYRRLAADAWSYLAPKGAVVVEIGADRGAAVAKIFDDIGRYAKARIFSDYAGQERVMAAQRLEPSGLQGHGWR